MLLCALIQVKNSVYPLPKPPLTWFLCGAVHLKTCPVPCGGHLIMRLRSSSVSGSVTKLPVTPPKLRHLILLRLFWSDFHRSPPAETQPFPCVYPSQCPVRPTQHTLPPSLYSSNCSPSPSSPVFPSITSSVPASLL